MFNLTKQERAVLLFLAAIILVGSLLEILSKKSSGLRSLMEFSHQEYPAGKIKSRSPARVLP